ncbi:MAG: XRE family transcriptional regulator [Catenulispora sp.]|nr:XRE family transcriptional regulator [Catenulispora sp.]
MAEQETSYALSDLVKRRRSELRLSLRGLAEKCLDPDTKEQMIKHGVIDRMEKREPITPLQYRELRALAIGLQLPVRDIQDAAGEQFLGITTTDLDGDRRVRILTNRALSMSPEDLDRLVSIAESFPVRADDPDSPNDPT